VFHREIAKFWNEIARLLRLLYTAANLPPRLLSEGMVSTRAGSLLLSIASICVRLTGQHAAADGLSIAALATLTFGVQRDVSFPSPTRVGSMTHGVSAPESSVVAR
jgi:hypothetical protein